MKKFIYLLLLLLLMVGCLEEIDTDTSFVKAIGKQGSSSGRKIILRSNGDIMILGKIGVPAFDITWTTQDIFIGRAQDIAPSITILDKRGNVKMMRTYPVPEIEVTNFIETFTDYQNKASFIDIVEMDDGSFFALGELRDFTITIKEEGIENLSNGVFSYFLMKLSPNFDQISFQSLNGEPGWDEVFRIDLEIKKLPNNELLLLTGWDNFRPYYDDHPDLRNVVPEKQGFGLMKFDLDGNLLIHRSYTNAGVKFIKNMNIDADITNIYMIGMLNENIEAYKVPVNSLELPDFKTYMDSSSIAVTQKKNNNEAYIFPLSSGNCSVVYTQPKDLVAYRTLDPDLKPIGTEEKRINGTVSEYPRAAAMTKNEEILVYTEQLASGESESFGYVYRLTSTGSVLFRKRIQGIPGDIVEDADGNILVLSNPVFNGLLLKTTLTKLSPDGTIF